MTNRFDAGTIRTPHGFIAYYRCVHEAENRVLRNGRHDITFGTEAEALKAAKDALLGYLNSPIVGISAMGGNVKQAKFASAERKLFKNGRMIPVESKGVSA